MDILLLIVGLVLILTGANYLVDGASAIAKRAGLSDFIIGLTIVGIGTSTPEMVVSFASAIKGNADIAVGNVLGSNIFNTLMILGATALFSPIRLTSNNVKKDIPFALLAAFVLCTFGCSTWLDGTAVNTISRVGGILLLSLFGVFMAYTIYSSSSQGATTDNPDNPSGSKKTAPIWLASLMILGGLCGLVFGGDMFVNAASAIAKSLGVSDAVIAVTIVAGGTSLPELASCLVAAYKKNTDQALGNVIGSNVSNIFLILGGSATIHPLVMAGTKPLDLITLMVSSLLIFLFAFTFKKKQIDRIEGALLVCLYIAFVVLTLKSL
ncbi:MAG: calcium/sodium antiporter [Bacteroidales bacterium]|nr:calcium/sodium antiporter [Bacteroidales bacterium]